MAKKMSESDEQTVKDEAEAEKEFQRDRGGHNPQLDEEKARDPRDPHVDNTLPKPERPEKPATKPVPKPVHPIATPHPEPEPPPEPTQLPAPEPSDEDLIRDHIGEGELKELILAEAKKRHLTRKSLREEERQAKIDEAAKAERAAAPLDYVGLDVGKTGVCSYMKLTKPPIAPDRTITIDGTTFEHTGEDSEGVWLYRHMS